MHDGIVDSNSGGGYTNPAVRPPAPDESVTIVLDPKAGISLKLEPRPDGQILFAVHDALRPLDEDSEVFAVPVTADRLWHASARMRQFLQQRGS